MDITNTDFAAEVKNNVVDMHGEKYTNLKLALNKIILESADDAVKKIQNLQNLVKQFVEDGNVYELKCLIHLLLSEEGQYALVSRPVLNEICLSIKSLKNDSQRNNLAQFLLNKLKGRTLSFEEEDVLVREAYASILISENCYKEAAMCLAAMNIEKGIVHKTAELKAAKYLQISELFIKAQEYGNAEIYISRCSMLMHAVKDVSVILKFQRVMANVLEIKGKFIDAAIRYYELSLKLADRDVSEESLYFYLQKAVNCAILSVVGYQRERLFDNLMKDERICLTRNFDILRKMYLGRLIKKSELSNFSNDLQEEEMQMNSNTKLSCLKNAILEHNIIAISKLYKSIKIRNFALMLDCECSTVEIITAKMIQQRQLLATIDKKNELIFFITNEDKKDYSNVNHDISSIFNRIDSIYEMIPNNMS